MKPWYKSRTVMAVLAGMVVRALAVVGINVDAEFAVEVLLLSASFIADVVALYGRSQAVEPVKWLK